jgi:choline dehydrogenase
MTQIPTEAEVIVVGGGTAGPIVAARLAAAGVNVLVLEAGPDPGPLGDPSWPAELVDATRLPDSHDWGYDSADTYPDQHVRFERARVIGGCSAHNGAVQTWGHRDDYDAWAAAGNPGWSTDELMAFFVASSEQLRVRTYEVAELTPWQAAWHAAAPGAGLPQLRDLNDLDETVGIAPESVNIVDGGVRFNNAFAYLDPVRDLPNLTIVGNAIVDRVLVENGRAVGVVVVHRGERVEVRAPRVVLTGGAFGTPLVLLRSGIGPAADLAALDIPIVADLPGVGANLHDQPFILMRWEGSPEMLAAMDAAAAKGWAPDEQVMAKAASSFDPGVFDIHLLPYSPTHFGPVRQFHAGAGALTPVSRGQITLGGRDPEAKPLIDHGFLTDPEGRDIQVLTEGVALLREIAAQPEMRKLLGQELTPGPEASIADHLRSHIDSYWHPVGTAAMGPESVPGAVVGARGEVHGVPGLTVADCSLMPFVSRATTHMPTNVIAERVASFLLEER